MALQDNNNALQNLSAIVDFSNNINSNLKLEFALNNLLLTCFGKLKITKGIIALFDEDGNLNISLAKGVTEEKLKIFPKLDLDNSNEHSFEEFVKECKIGIIEEIVSSDQLLGYLLLGEKFTKEEFDKQDKQFISTILSIGSTTIRNSQNFEQLSSLNKVLDSKINQLNSIFDLGKEFSSILELERVSKLLVYSVSAQMLISKYAIVIFSDAEKVILDSKYDHDLLTSLLNSQEIDEIQSPKKVDAENKFCKKCSELGVALIVPMMIKNEKKGLIFLGLRITKQEYSQSDIEYISSIASFAIISIENARLFNETLEKQKLEKDLETARNIQQNLLPNKIPISDTFEVAAINLTAKMVGGDFYDVVKLDDNRLLVAIADVSGKGIQASLLMANLQAFLKSIYKQNYKLQEASNFLNDLVSENTTNGSFITFFWGILKLDSLEFTYVNMGHNPPLLVRENKITKLRKGGMILGVMETIIPYEYETVKLQKKDTIYLFTDGVTEAMNKKNEEYSDERFEELSLKIADHDAQKILNNILADVDNHTSGAEQSDDITSLILKIK